MTNFHISCWPPLPVVALTIFAEHHKPMGLEYDGLLWISVCDRQTDRHPVDNFVTVVGENPSCYGILPLSWLWAVNGLSIVCWADRQQVDLTLTANVLQGGQKVLRASQYENLIWPVSSLHLNPIVRQDMGPKWGLLQSPDYTDSKRPLWAPSTMSQHS